MIFLGLSVARNCVRPETAPLTILAIKRGLLCNFAKHFQGCHSVGQSFKKYVKSFFKFCFSITSSKFGILILCNILHLEMKFVLENDSYFIHFLTKASLK